MYVRGQMLGEIVRPGEAFATRLAVIGPFAGMDAQMAGQVRLAAKGAAAEEANERTFARVLAHVQLEVLLGAHALAAKGAGKARCCRPEMDAELNRFQLCVILCNTYRLSR